MDSIGTRINHDPEIVIMAVAAKLRSKAGVLAQIDDHFVLEIHKKGAGYDVKLKPTL